MGRGRGEYQSTSACITRLRMEVKSSKDLDENLFKKLGAKGVIKPTDRTIQIVLGVEAEKIAGEIRGELNG